MCGIFGIALSESADVGAAAHHALSLLQYRGYDSCGYVVYPSGAAHRAVGSIAALPSSAQGTAAIAHTRWATHGPPSLANTHPIPSPDRFWWVVHNGVLQNHEALQRQFGFVHQGETDTEIFASLAQHLFDTTHVTASFVEVVQSVLALVDGSYAVLFMSQHFPGEIVAACNGSPLLIASSPSGVYLASDPLAFQECASHYTRCENGDVVHVHVEERGASNYTVYPRNSSESASSGNACLYETPVALLPSDHTPTPTSGHASDSMLSQEILGTPDALRAFLRGRVHQQRLFFGGIAAHAAPLKAAKRWILVGCGSSYNAALCARSAMGTLLPGVEISLEDASDIALRTPPIDPHAIYIFVSQSGETRDVLRAAQHVAEASSSSPEVVNRFGIHNRPGSQLDAATQAGIHLNIGPERAVAATKSFTASIVALIAMATAVSPLSKLAEEWTRAIAELPTHLEKYLTRCQHAADLSRVTATLSASFTTPGLWWTVGDDWGYGLAQEMALKLQEVAYIPIMAQRGHAMKHGPLALVDADARVFLWGPHIDTIAPILTARGATVVTLPKAARVAGPAGPWLSMMSDVIAIQWLTFQVGMALGRNVDHPRNLAKSVTV